MGKIIRAVFIAAIGFFALLFSLQSLTRSGMQDNLTKLPQVVRTPLNSVIKEPTAEIDDQPFRDNTEIYQSDDPGSIVTLYVTVVAGEADDHSNFSWRQLNNFVQWFEEDPSTIEVQKAKVIVQFGDENGPLPGQVGYEAVAPNATIHVRGASTSLQPQLSYQIELSQAAGRWRGQSTIVLNKHFTDPSRIRNKLNFDLLRTIPDIVSLRTQFVHLYVRDRTMDAQGIAFTDYGLYTQIELPNQRYLRAHLLDANGQLYKAVLFQFDRYPDEIRLFDDPLFDEEAFSSRLEIKGNRDNRKLIQMLDGLNNPDIPIEATFEKYLDADNYFTWLAYNILVGNVNTVSQNFYLYSPQNGNKFYLIPWDYDDSFFRLDRENCCGYRPYDSYQYGVANYWESRLANRVLRVPAYRQMLDAKVKELRDILTQERIKDLLDIYKPVAEKYALQMPDVQYLPTTAQGMQADLEAIPAEVQNNYEMYLESLQVPMPFHLGTPTLSEGRLNFTWEEAYDFNDQPISYRIVVARDPILQDIVIDETLTSVTSIQIETQESGEYYWTVTAINRSGKMQRPLDHVFDFNGISHPGLKRFYIFADGSVKE